MFCLCHLSLATKKSLFDCSLSDQRQYSAWAEILQSRQLPAYQSRYICLSLSVKVNQLTSTVTQTSILHQENFHHLGQTPCKEIMANVESEEV